MRKIIFFLTLFVFLIDCAQATNYYVRKDGNDANDGLANTSGRA